MMMSLFRKMMYEIKRNVSRFTTFLSLSTDDDDDVMRRHHAHSIIYHFRFKIKKNGRRKTKKERKPYLGFDLIHDDPDQMKSFLQYSFGEDVIP